ncbi:MAG: REP element-mobilizing transposase RayT [Akkermansiaceae bacterium]|jgi:REP element-mobilizing transposase RayT
MPQSLANIYIHLIFSTSDRQPLLTDDIRPSLHSYLGQVGKTLGCPIILVNSVEGHVHILHRISRTVTISKAVEEFKKSTSKWLKSQSPDLANFSWQSGYGAFSVSESNLDSVTVYIQNQREHHRTKSFQDEFREFLIKNNLPFD